jgi:hypothetical protein
VRTGIAVQQSYGQMLMLCRCVTHLLCRCPSCAGDALLSVAAGLARLRLYVESLGRYGGTGAVMLPAWGCGSIVEARYWARPHYAPASVQGSTCLGLLGSCPLRRASAFGVGVQIVSDAALSTCLLGTAIGRHGGVTLGPPAGSGQLHHLGDQLAVLSLHIDGQLV